MIFIYKANSVSKHGSVKHSSRLPCFFVLQRNVKKCKYLYKKCKYLYRGYLRLLIIHDSICPLASERISMQSG